VNTPYEGAMTSTKSLSVLDNEMRTVSGCGGTCASVDVKHYPADFGALKQAWLISIATPTPQATFTPEPVVDWTTAKLGTVPNPTDLSNVTLLRATSYNDPRPSDDCTAQILAGDVNNISCSTKGGASYNFVVHLNTGQAINVNGDASQILMDGKPLSFIASGSPNHRLTSAICLKAPGCDLTVDLPWAGFVGWFQRSNWTQSAAENIFFNQARLIIVPVKLESQIPPGQSTPVPNCGSDSNGCQKIWASQVVITDSGNYTTAAGIYDEQSPPYWFPQ